MKLRRLASLVCTAILLTAAHAASAQGNWPTKSVTLVVPYGPGSTDTFSRILVERLTQIWGQTIVIDSRPGGSGVLGMTVGRDAAPDGYTLLLGMSGPLAGNPNLMPKLPYDPLKDYTMVAGLLQIPLMFIAHPDAPFNSIQEMVDYAKKNPGKLEWGSPGNGTTNHLGGELFKTRAGIDILHVPYKAAARGVSDVAGGHIKMLSGGVSESTALIKAGKLKGLAVTGLQRAPMLPDVPTVSESGFPGYENVGWGGMLAPQGVPRPIVEKIEADLRRVLAEPAFRARMIQTGLVPDFRDGPAFRSYVVGEIEKWGKVVKQANIKLQ